jgi:hypothetical protein
MSKDKKSGGGKEGGDTKHIKETKGKLENFSGGQPPKPKTRIADTVPPPPPKR